MNCYHTIGDTKNFKLIIPIYSNTEIFDPIFLFEGFVVLCYFMNKMDNDDLITENHCEYKKHRTKERNECFVYIDEEDKMT